MLTFVILCCLYFFLISIDLILGFVYYQNYLVTIYFVPSYQLGESDLSKDVSFFVLNCPFGHEKQSTEVS